MIFTIAIIGYGQSAGARAYEDFSNALKDALVELGHKVTPPSDPGQLILLGAHLSRTPERIPSNAILFNTEQLSVLGVPEFYKKHVVWDYSKVNISILKAAGVEQAVYCPVGYISSMTKFVNADLVATKLGAAVEPPLIDVLFYGAGNAGRRKTLYEFETVKNIWSTSFQDQLKRFRETSSPPRIAWFYGYGEERDKAISVSKIVLNLHYYEKSIFEIFRCSHLFANRVCVVSEDGGLDPDLEDLAHHAALVVQRDKLADTCLELIESPSRRVEIAEQGFLEFTKSSLIDNVQQALDGQESSDGTSISS